MKPFHFAILGTGHIASSMADTVSQMNGVKLYAVASRTLDKADAFAKKHQVQKAYGSYEALVSDKAVDLVYVATPHSEHFANCRLCIKYHKPVLCEKSFTANAAMARELIRLAQQEHVFISEAIWTRYMPMLDTIRQTIESGIIGRPTMLTANLGYPIDKVPRMQDPALAGGALLDVGVYPINFAFMLFGHEIEKVTSACTYTKTGVDEQNSITITYKDGRMAVLNSSMLSLSDRKGILHGSEGFLIIENINNYESFTVYNSRYEPVREVKRPHQISGYEYEVNACIRSISLGQTGCEEMPHSETIRVMEFMDSLREEWKIRYPFE